jgi:hypothetical protein
MHDGTTNPYRLLILNLYIGKNRSLKTQASTLTRREDLSPWTRDCFHDSPKPYSGFTFV